MIIYLDKNKKPNVVCDGGNILTDILEGGNIVIERDLENKTITISSDAREDIMESIKAGENVTIGHDLENKTITINSDAKNETINSIKAGDNIVIMDNGSGDVTINTLIDILDKNPLNPKPGYMWILNNGGNTGTGSGSTDEGTDGNVTIKDGTFACFDESGNFYCSEDCGVSWQKRGKIECDSGVYPVAGIALAGNTIATAVHNTLYYSNDAGSTWEKCTQSVYSYVRSIHNINGKLYACCGNASYSATAPAVLLSSNNGITWKTALQKYNTSHFVFSDIQYINNKYFLFAWQTIGGGSRILYSSNGTSWNECTGDNTAFPVFPGLIHNGTFYICANSDTFEIYTSTDGKNWTATGEKIVNNTGSARNLVTMEEIEGKFYAVLSHMGLEQMCGTAISSANGIKWGDTGAGDVVIVVTPDISNGLHRYNDMTYLLNINGTLLSSGGFAPWKHVGTVPLEDPGNVLVSCFSILHN